MAAQTDPRFGLAYGWSLGENGWNTGMDANLLKLARVGVHLSVKDRDLTTPPASPATGGTYIVAATATGAWAGKEGQVAIWSGSAWVFYTPRLGWVTYIEDEEKLSAYKAAGWSAGIAI
jgi:hypothetical protein